MVRKTTPLVVALALLLVAVGGATAADAAGTTTPSITDDSDAEDDDVGICVVGADSPCNSPGAENGTTDSTSPDESTATDGTDAEAGGELDGTNDSEDEAGICLVGADSPCNDESDHSADGEPIGSPDGDESQLWIPEDQNRDGQIDDRFTGEGVTPLIDFGLSLVGLA